MAYTLVPTELIVDGAITSAKLDTNIAISGTLGVTGEVTLATHLIMGDNDKIKIGAGGDLEIYHDGSNSYISNSTGNIYLGDTNGAVHIQAKLNEESIVAAADGAVTLYHDNAVKLATSSAGVTVTGTLAATLSTAAQPNITSVGTLTSFRSTGIDDNADALAMTIDSSENLMIGKSATGGNTAGMQILKGSFFSHVRDDGVVQVLNRKTSDGDILQFEKDNSIVGSIGARAGDLTIGTGNCGLIFNDGTEIIIPANITTNAVADATVDLGYSGGRFKDLYLSGTANALVGSFGDNVSIASSGVLGVTDSDLVVYNPISGHSGLRFGAAFISPTSNSGASTDAAVDLGQSGVRFKDLYLSNSAIIEDDASSPSLLIKSGGQGSSTTPTASIFLSSGSLSSNASAPALISYRTADYSTTALRSSGLKFQVTTSNVGKEAMRLDNVGDARFAANATGAALIKGVSGDQADRDNSGYPQYTFVGNEGTGMRRVASNILAFDSSGAERMRIDANGRVGIGGTSSGAGTAGLTVNNGDIRTTAAAFANKENSFSMSQESSGGTLCARGADNGTRGTIQLTVNAANGGNGRVGLKIANDGSVDMAYMPSGSASSDVHINLSTNKLFYVSSSQRYKTNITDLSTSTADILSLRPVNYDRVSEELTGEVGLIAEEVYEIIPHLVNLADVDGFDTPQPESVKYSQLSVYLLKAIQEQQTIIDDLKSRIETLEG